MIQKIKLSFGIFTILFVFGAGAISLSASSASAEILDGYVIPGGVLSCNLFNPSQFDQMIDTVQYHFVCNNGPYDPFHYYFESTGCFGPCVVKSYQRYLVTNGPYTGGCWIIQADCIGFSHPVSE